MSIQAFLLNCNTPVRLISAILILVLSSGCAPGPGKQEIQLSGVYTKTIHNNKQSMHYAYSGDVSKPGVLFIHGTPGGWSAFVGYLNNKELQKQFFMVSVDRLNWGKSELNQAFSFDSQADAIHLVMQNYPSQKWILVGHSLGASIAPRNSIKIP